MPKLKATKKCTCTQAKCGFRCGYREGKKRSRDWVETKKQAAAGRNFAEGYQTGKQHGRALTIKAKAATKKGAKLAAATTALPFIWGHAAAYSVRAKSTTRAHRHLERKANWYAVYHQQKHHRKFHYAAAGFHGLVYLVIGLVVFISAIGPARAYNTWQQTDWSGGVGSSTTNQYSAANNVVTSTTGQITLDTTTISDWCNNVSCDSMWVKRKRVTFNSNENASNHVVNINVSYDSDMQADFADLRFTATDGTELPYFIESKTNSSTANVLVKVNTINSGANSIYAYYGNGAAVSTADASQIYDVYDDFSGGSIDGAKWNTSGSPSVSGGKALIPYNSYITSQTQSDMTADNVFQWDVKAPDWCNNGGSLGFSMGTNGSYPYSFTNMSYSCGGNHLYSLYVNDRGSNFANIAEVANIPADSTRTYRVVAKADGNDSYYYSSDGGNNFIKMQGVSGSGGISVAGLYFSNSWDGNLEIDNAEMYRMVSGSTGTANLGIEEEQGGKVGNLTSAIFDAGAGAFYGNVSWRSSGSGIVGVAVRSSNDPAMSGAADLDSCTLLTSGAAISASNCVTIGQRYLQYRVYLSDSASSTLNLADISLEHDNDSTPPSANASSLVMKRTASGDTITTGWTNNQSPYFSWTAGVDNSGGAGIKGYCVYLGTDETADPTTTKGDITADSPVDSGGACQYVTSSLNIDFGSVNHNNFNNNTTYYLNIKAIDNINNVYSGASAQYTFGFDQAKPAPPFNASGPQTWVNSKIFTISWTGMEFDGIILPNDFESGLAGIQYCITNLDFPGDFEECDQDSQNWYGAAHTGVLSDVISARPDGGGSFSTVPADASRIKDNGQSFLLIRAVDKAGNKEYTPSYITVNYSTTAPTTPQNLNVSPSTSTSNNFSFSWNAPATYIGQASGINYCWSVNALPAANTCTFAGAGIISLSAGAYATQPGLNTMYIVARDEAGNIDYNNRASVTFTANTAAPGAPRTLSVVDASVKDTADWKLALSWSVPSLVGSGVHHYDIYRSPDNLVFNKIGSTTATSFVDASLEQIRYYYYVKACDNAYNCGAASNTDDELPTGRFTSPAVLTSGPESSDISTRKTKISWSTDRASDSKIQLGTSSGQYDPDQVANSTQVTGHIINLTNLRPGTTYYYKAQWTDRDGNIGSSGEKSFTTLPAPSCRDVEASRIGLSEANLQLTCRDSSKIKVLYGKSEQFGGQVVVNTSTTESTYNVPLTGLDDGTKYSYKLNTFDGDGNEYDGAVTFNFTTPPRPKISNLQFQPVPGEPTSTQQVTWTTNVLATSALNYGKTGGSTSETADSKLVTDHEMIIRGLEDSSEYFLIAQSRDATGNLATSDRQVFRTALDTRSPKLTNVTVEPSIKGTGADARGQLIVSWHTDEPATSQVSFDDGKGGTTSRTNEDAALVTDHVVVVSDLSPAQVYSVIATSRDKSGNSVNSTTQSAIVGRASDSIFAIIFNALQQIFGLSSK